VDGRYGDGSHKTGIGGVLDTQLSAQELFDSLKTDHGFGDAGMDDDALWDATRFVLKSTVDNDNFIDGEAFNGVADAGQPTYENVCVTCHGDDGLSVPPGADATDYDHFVGAVANDNPWEFLHKVRFGQPGTQMPPQAELLTDEELSDLGAYAQTLPTAP
jgi:thiosulfate dehydrogenase